MTSPNWRGVLQRRWLGPRVWRFALRLLITLGLALATAALNPTSANAWSPFSIFGVSSDAIDESVIEAAANARMACRPGTLKDRIITDHIELIASSLAAKAALQVSGAYKMVGFCAGGLSVVAFVLILLNKTSDDKLKKAEMDMFGELRNAETNIAEDEDETDEFDDIDFDHLEDYKKKDDDLPKKDKNPSKDD